jgi:hypothetical protein
MLVHRPGLDHPIPRSADRGLIEGIERSLRAASIWQFRDQLIAASLKERRCGRGSRWHPDVDEIEDTKFPEFTTFQQLSTSYPDLIETKQVENRAFS